MNPLTLYIRWCRGTESNRRHEDFQSSAGGTDFVHFVPIWLYLLWKTCLAGATLLRLVAPVTSCLLHNWCTIGGGGTPPALVEIEMKVLIKTAPTFLGSHFLLCKFAKQ